MMTKKKKVLIIEDDSIMGMEMQGMLEDWDYEVLDVISTGEKAVERAQSTSPDLLIIDIKIKGAMTGIEVAQRVRLFTEAPIIFLTGYKNSSTQEKAAVIRNMFFLTKPFDITQIRDLISQVLGENG